MAPKKRSREATARNRDKCRRLTQRRSHDLPIVYKCLGRLCGEECERELIPVSESRSSHNNAPKPSEETASEVSDVDYGEERRMRKDSSRTMRITKLKRPTYEHKLSTSIFEHGLRKARLYVSEALNFGVESGFLTKKDKDGKLLRVASEIMDESEQHQQEQAVHVPEAQGRDRGKASRSCRHRDYDPRDVCATPQMEDGEEQKTGSTDRTRPSGQRRSRKRASRGRSRSNVRKRSKRLVTAARNRSHSRRSNRRRSIRSRSVHPSDPRVKSPTGDNKPLQDMLHDADKVASTSIDDNEDGEETATKAPKSSKSSPSIGKQTAEGKKQRSEEKQDNSDDSEDDDKQKK